MLILLATKLIYRSVYLTKRYFSTSIKIKIIRLIPILLARVLDPSWLANLVYSYNFSFYYKRKAVYNMMRKITIIVSKIIRNHCYLKSFVISNNNILYLCDFVTALLVEIIIPAVLFREGGDIGLVL